MAFSDYNKQKKLDVDSVSGTPTVDKATPIIIGSGDDSTTGNGDIIIDWTNVSSESDLAVYDQNDNLLGYEIEEFDATNETAVLWCYDSWVRDGTTQAKVVYGDGPTKPVKEADGFEDGDFSSSPTWTQVNGSNATVQGMTVKNGSNALLLEGDSNTQTVQHDRGTGSDTISDGDVYQCWIRVTGTDEYGAFGLSNTSADILGNDAIALRLTNGGQFQAITRDGSGGGLEATTNGSYSANTWYRAEVEIVPTNSEAIFRIYNESEQKIFKEILTTSGATDLQYVMVEDFGNTTNDWYFDDVSYSTTDSSTLTTGDNEEGSASDVWGNTGQNAEIVYHDPSNPFDSVTATDKGTVNGVSSTTASQFGNSAGDYDGTDDYHDTDFNPSSEGVTGNLTVIQWIKPDDFAEAYRLFGGFDGTNQWKLQIESSSSDMAWITFDGTGYGLNPETDMTLESANWNHIGATFNNSSGYELFEDGSSIGTSGDTTQATPNIDMGIGAGIRSGSQVNYFKGLIDETRVYSETKSQDWIQADYDASPKAGQVFFTQQAAETTGGGVTEDTAVTTTFQMTPQTSTETNNRVDTAQTTSYSFTPLTSTEQNDPIDSAVTTSYVMTPQTSDDFENFTDTAQTTSYVMSPQTSNESQVNVDTAIATTFQMTPLTSNEEVTELDNAATTSFTMTPVASDETNNVTDVAVATSYSITPQQSTEIQTIIESAQTTSYEMTPQTSQEVLIQVENAQTTTFEMTPLTSTEDLVQVGPDVRPPLEFTADSMDKYFNER